MLFDLISQVKSLQNPKPDVGVYTPEKLVEQHHSAIKYMRKELNCIVETMS